MTTIHPTHASIYLAFGFGIIGTGLLRQVPNDYSLLYIVFGMYAFGLAMLYAFKRMSNRAATAIIFRDHLALLVGAKRVEIPWAMLDKLLILNCPSAGKRATPSRRMISCSKKIPSLRAPRYLFIQPNSHERKLLDWIRQRVNRERDIKICSRRK